LYYKNEIEAFPEPNSPWWTEPIRIRNTTELAADTSTNSEDELWANFADEDAAARAELEQRLSTLNLD
jgi:hypothetical protein